MALETGTYINSLNAANPAATDGLSQADDHLRLIKSTIKSTFPNLSGPVTATQTQLNLLTGATSLVPSGVIMMWSGATSAIPSGYVLCNGSNSTPDLRGRFVIGAQGDSGNTYDVGDTGGATSVTLSTSNMPAHTHSFSGTTSSAGAHTHSVSDPGHSHHLSYYSAGDGGDGGGAASGNDSYNNSGNSQNLGTNSATTGISINSGGAHTHTVSGTTGSNGSGSAVSTVPPYYALCYIMKT